MSIKIEEGDTAPILAQKMLGDARLVHELFIPGWTGGPLPVGQHAYLKDEKHGPPSRDWSKPRG